MGPFLDPRRRLKACTTIQFSKTNPFQGERKQYSSNPVRVNGHVRNSEAKFPQAAPQSAAERESTHIMTEVKPSGGKKSRSA